MSNNLNTQKPLFVTGYLHKLTFWITTSDWMHSAETSAAAAANGTKSTKINILGAITKPFTKRIVQVRPENEKPIGEHDV